jgi:hypothetical protein
MDYDIIVKTYDYDIIVKTYDIIGKLWTMIS